MLPDAYDEYMALSKPSAPTAPVDAYDEYMKLKGSVPAPVAARPDIRIEAAKRYQASLTPSPQELAPTRAPKVATDAPIGDFVLGLRHAAASVIDLAADTGGNDPMLLGPRGKDIAKNIATAVRGGEPKDLAGRIAAHAGETVGSFAMAPYMIPASIVSAGQKALRAQSVKQGIVSGGKDLGGFLLGFVPIIPETQRYISILRDPQIDDAEKQKAFEDYIGNLPVNLAATAPMLKAVASMVKGPAQKAVPPPRPVEAPPPEPMPAPELHPVVQEALKRAEEKRLASLVGEPNPFQGDDRATIEAVNAGVRQMRGEPPPDLTPLVPDQPGLPRSAPLPEGEVRLDLTPPPHPSSRAEGIIGAQTEAPPTALERRLTVARYVDLEGDMSGLTDREHTMMDAPDMKAYGDRLISEKQRRPSVTMGDPSLQVPPRVVPNRGELGAVSLGALADELIHAPEAILKALRDSGEPLGSMIQDRRSQLGAVSPAAMLGLPGQAIRAVRESSIPQYIKQHLGKQGERFQSILGDQKGKEATAAIRDYQVERDLGQIDAFNRRVRKFTAPWFFDKLEKTPYVGERGAAKISYFLRGINAERRPQVFQAAEAIKDIDQNGNPVFGTMDKTFDPKTGKPILDPLGNPVMKDSRYTPTEGKALWDALTPREQNVVKWHTVDDQLQKIKYNIAGDVEGHVHHIWDDKVTDQFRRIFMSKRKAAPRRMRTGAEGYTEDLLRSGIAGEIKLRNEKSYNDFITKFSDIVTEPLPAGQDPNPGWVELDKSRFTKNGKYAAQLAGGRQIPAQFHDEFVRMVEAPAASAGLEKAIGNLTRYWKTQAIMRASTLGLKTITDGLLWTTLMVNRFHDGMVKSAVDVGKRIVNGTPMPNPVDRFKPFLYGTIAPLDTLRPSVIEGQPPELWGGTKSGFMSEFGQGQPKTMIGKAAALPITVPSAVISATFGSLSNYFQRMIRVSELRAAGKPVDTQAMSGDPALEEHIRNIIDTVSAQNYADSPEFIKWTRSNALGAAIGPFLTMKYNLARVKTHYLSAIPDMFDPKIPIEDALPRLLTLGTMMAAIHYVNNRKEPKTGSPLEGMHTQLDTTGQTKIGSGADVKYKGKTTGTERFMRTGRYPWFDFDAQLKAGKALYDGYGGGQMADVAKEFLPDGPLLQGLELAKQATEDGVPHPGAAVGGLVKGFIPFGPQLEAYRKTAGGPQTTPTTFMQAIRPSLPITQHPEEGKLRIDPNTKKPVIANPSLEQLKFWTGVALKDINPAEYNDEKKKLIRSAMESIHSASNPTQFDDAKARLIRLDPPKFIGLTRFDKKEIRLDAKQKALWHKLQSQR